MTQLDWYLGVNLKARQLRLLVALDDFRNLRQVAANSYVTVPAVSKALGELEKGLGMKLFERTMRGLRPTIYGECLVGHARTLLADLNQTADELKALQSGVAGKIHIGALPTLISTLLPRSLALLKQSTPGANVLISEGRMSALLPELRRGELDMIVGRLPNKSDTSGLEEKVLFDTPVAFVTGPHHPLARKRKLQWSELTGFPWILPPPGSLLREPLENTFARHSIPMPSNYIETLSTHLIRSYLQISDAIAIYAGDLLRNVPDLAPISVLPLELSLITRPLGIIWNRDKSLAPSARLLLDCLAQASKASAKAVAG